MCGKNSCDSPDCTWGSKFLLECEARHLLTLPKPERIEALAHKFRVDRRAALEAEILRQWDRSRAERSPVPPGTAERN